MNHYKDQILACDFFTVETIWLKTIYTSRPHQGIDNQTPIPHQQRSFGPIHRKKILGGIINNYYRDPAPSTLTSS
jgi:hypothetical protein